MLCRFLLLQKQNRKQLSSHTAIHCERKPMEAHLSVEFHPFSLTSQWPPRSSSANLPKQVIFSSSTWQSPAGPAYPHPIPFSFPCCWKKRDRDKGICLTVGSCFMWSIWESAEERREVFWRGLAKRARSPLEEQRVLELDDLFGEALRSQKGD